MATLNNVKPEPLPDLKIPASQSLVKVSIIDSTSRLSNIPSEVFLQPHIKGYDYLVAPAYSFLIENEAKGQKILFDLGVRKDWENLSPTVVNRIKSNNWRATVSQNVSEILTAHSVPLTSINAIIWSHHHWDHTGDPSLFPPSTSLIVGPNFKTTFTPGYPTNPSSPILSSDYAGRNLVETAFDTGPTLGRFPAVDFFGDGSFYLLDTPGHAVGHLCGLARTSVCPDRFVFMGGDAAHHAGEFRPTRYLPLPREVAPNPYLRAGEAGKGAMAMAMVCPGEAFRAVHPRGESAEPFYGPAEGVSHDVEVARESIRRMMEFDGREDVLSVMAHDNSLLGVVGFFPEAANGWEEKGWRGMGLWRFLGDWTTEEGRGQD